MGERRTLGDVGTEYRSVVERRAAVAQRLSQDRDCWLVTADRSGEPYVVPLSFVTLGSGLLLVTARERRSVCNAESNPRVAVILGGFGDTIRAYGDCSIGPVASTSPALLARFAADAGWTPPEDFVCLAIALRVITCSRNPQEDVDRRIWQSPDRPFWD